VTWSAAGGFPGNFDFSRLNFQVPAQAPAGVFWAFRCDSIANDKTGVATSPTANFIMTDFILPSPSSGFIAFQKQ
jgi:hypothetical protein